ncbi:MAG: sulfatase [bacterium]
MQTTIRNVTMLLTGAAALPLFTSSCTGESEEESEQPNVLYIIVDDLGKHDLSCTGSEYYETPNIDRLAGESMNFTNGYAASQVSSPSRASIMTGKSPARHGITDWIGARTGEDWREQGRHNKLLPPEYVDHLPHKYVTWPEAMKEAGYKTFFAGKWHLGDEGSYPEDHGFDINQGGFEAGGPYTGGYFSPFNNPKMEDHEDEKGMSLSEKLAKETNSFIEQNKDTAFFAFLSFYAVHAPIQTTQENWKKYRDKADEMGIAPKGEGFEMGHFLPVRQIQDNPIYAGLVEHVDDAVGQVLQTLEENGLDDNTIVIFTSDHGGVCAGDDYATTNKPLLRGKGYQYEGGLRVPYFIKVPGLTDGETCDVPVNNTDFYPTVLDLVGEELKPDEHNDGKSLVPLLKGNKIEERDIYWHYPHYGNQGGQPSSIIRRGDWKLVHYYEDGRNELYNVNEDLSETTDLSSEQPEKTRELAEALNEYLENMDVRYPEKDPQYDPELEKQHLEEVENNLLPRLEEQRMEFLSEDYTPGNNWWGSEVSDE